MTDEGLFSEESGATTQMKVCESFIHRYYFGPTVVGHLFLSGGSCEVTVLFKCDENNCETS